MKYIVDIKGEIEGDYEIIGKYEERPQGKWLEDLLGDTQQLLGYYCSLCFAHALDLNDYPVRTNFCPNCGAKMRGDSHG